MDALWCAVLGSNLQLRRVPVRPKRVPEPALSLLFFILLYSYFASFAFSSRYCSINFTTSLSYESSLPKV
jgi:hypothetical protein